MPTGTASGPASLHLSRYRRLRAGNITVTDSTANDTIEDDGLELHSDGDIVVCGVTANSNGDGGIDLDEDSGKLASARVTNSVVENNLGAGIDFDTTELSSIGTFLANGNNISGNAVNGLELDAADVTVDATGNWWGDASGPTNAGGTGDSIDPGPGTVDFDPFLTSPSADAGICEPTPTPTATATPAAPVTPTAVAEEVQQPEALPTTGGTPSDGGASALPWLAAIAGAIALIGSGSALFAYQRRRVR